VDFEDVARVVRLVNGRSDGFADFEGDYGSRETYTEVEHNPKGVVKHHRLSYYGLSFSVVSS
jgi:hypothetical protein